ncbi:hypothetical protein QP185_19530 [Sphingomonas aerolata]|uniref:hypothetical protein n=1 Tax=Sphingomonas aerolata TaxID=185951 RepID=UPI002FE2ED0C
MSDRIMELVGTFAQQKPGDPGDPARRDNLYDPRADALRGTQHVRARTSSSVLQAQKLHPAVVMLGVVGAGIVVALGRPKGGRR